MDLLSASQIATLRSDWIADEVDLRPEWGASPTIGTATAGATVATFSALNSGTIKAGSAFMLTHGNRPQTYYVRANVTIASNTASISFAPGLAAATTTGDRVLVQAYRRSAYNKKAGAVFFEDSELLRIADVVEQKRGSWIYAHDNPAEARYRCIRIECFRRMLASTDWYQTLLIGEDTTAIGDRSVQLLQAQLADDERIVESDERGPRNLRFVR